MQTMVMCASHTDTESIRTYAILGQSTNQGAGAAVMPFFLETSCAQAHPCMARGRGAAERREVACQMVIVMVVIIVVVVVVVLVMEWW